MVASDNCVSLSFWRRVGRRGRRRLLSFEAFFNGDDRFWRTSWFAGVREHACSSGLLALESFGRCYLHSLVTGPARAPPIHFARFSRGRNQQYDVKHTPPATLPFATWRSSICSYFLPRGGLHWRLHGRNRVQASQSRIRKQVLGHAMLMIEFLRERHHLHHHIFFTGAHSDDARLERFRRDGGRERGALYLSLGRARS